jgi:hypothetical protein
MVAIQSDHAVEASINIQENSGQLAIGKYVVQIGSVHGGEVNIAMPAEQPQWRLRMLPILLRPRRFPGLLDRQPEGRAATAALQNGVPLEFHGQPGQGKTSLLRHLAYQLSTSTYPDGIVYLRVGQQPQSDLLQFLYEAFFEVNIPAKPTVAEIRHGLSRRQALILLDDVELPGSDVETLLDLAPECAFLLASSQRRLWGGGKSRALGGLPPEDALTLLTRELERSLTAEEESAALTLCTLLDGHPLHLLQIGGLVRDQNLTLVKITAELERTSPRKTLATQLLAGLSAPEQQVVGLLAALKGTPLGLEHVAELAGLPDPLPVLEKLQQRQIIHSHSPYYSLTGILVENWPSDRDLSTQTGQLLTYFAAWAEQQSSAERVLAEAGTLLQVLSTAVRASQWPETLRLARAIEGSFSLSGRWGMWAKVLQSALQAADGLGDRSAKAWVWHQLGTRALCLDDAATAQANLGRALRLRQGLGDHAGAEVTHHNLDILLSPPPPPQSPSQPPPSNGPTIGPSGVLWSLLWIAGVLLTLLVALQVWQGRPDSALISAPTAPTSVAQVTLAAAQAILPGVTPTNSPAITVTDVPPSSTNAVLSATGTPPSTPVPGDTPASMPSPTTTAADVPPPPTSTALSATGTPTPTSAPTDADTPPPTAAPTSTDVPLSSTDVTPTPTDTLPATSVPSDTPASTPSPTITFSPTPPPEARLSSENLDFGSLPVGDRSEVKAVGVVNIGGGLLSIISANLEGQNVADFQINASDCLNQSGLPANGDCTVSVGFRPTASGNRRARLTIITNGSDTSRTVFLTGTGQADPLISLKPTALDFGEQPVGSTGKTQNVNVTNAGQADLVIGSLDLNGDHPGDFSLYGSCLKAVLPPGGSCVISLGFTPRATDVRIAELIVSGNAPNSPQGLLLRGVGIAQQPDLVITGFEVTGPARLNQNSEVLLPVAVVIQNQGSAQAERFKVSIEYSDPKGTFGAPFTVPKQTDLFYPSTDGPLAAGGTVSFSGFVTLPARNQGQTISLAALVDSCSGDEFMPRFCRVEESSEENNRSKSRLATLPSE